MLSKYIIPQIHSNHSPCTSLIGNVQSLVYVAKASPTSLLLTDEAADGGKDANTVISRLHFHLEQYELGEEEAFLHADNCAGQNKNNTVMITSNS